MFYQSAYLFIYFSKSQKQIYRKVVLVENNISAHLQTSTSALAPVSPVPDRSSLEQHFRHIFNNNISGEGRISSSVSSKK